MKTKPIFLLGTGRCGSTLVQRILNSSPEVLILGEHNGFLISLAEAYFSLTSTPNVRKWIFDPGFDTNEMIAAARDPKFFSAWLNSFTIKRVRYNFRRMIAGVLADEIDLVHVRWGFKEIRYGENDRVLPMLLELYPEASYIFIFRNVMDTIKSMLTAWRPNLPDRLDDLGISRKEISKTIMEYANRWANQNDKLLDFSDKYPDNSLIVKYEHLSENGNDVVDRIFSFIDISRPDEVEKVLMSKTGATSHKYHGNTMALWLMEEQDRIFERVAKVRERLGY